SRKAENIRQQMVFMEGVLARKTEQKQVRGRLVKAVQLGVFKRSVKTKQVDSASPAGTVAPQHVVTGKHGPIKQHKAVVGLLCGGQHIGCFQGHNRAWRGWLGANAAGACLKTLLVGRCRHPSWLNTEPAEKDC
ncbi:MAG: hypothetical protein U1E02_26710, partial [Hydrogenophaga sp.]|nr:hypothetical protein [Hydrogenophaga sp.]